MSRPEISVVVASHDRPLRLRWLLNALEEQTLPPDRWEVIVGHDSPGDETERVLGEHPLTQRGVLRSTRVPATSPHPGANRNAGWKMARAPLVAFTDDDCRPARDWLERALAAAARHPGAIVQGRTLPDPLESNIRAAPRWHSQAIDPPTPWAEACNIVFERAALEATGGFPEDMWGEDAALALQVRRRGARQVGAPELLAFHAVEEVSLRGQLRSVWRWRDLPLMIRRHPELRADYYLWIFWKPTHVWLPFFLLGAWLGERRSPPWRMLCIPWLLHGPARYGPSPRARLRALLELPSALIRDSVEFAALAVGSVRHKTLFL